MPYSIPPLAVNFSNLSYWRSYLFKLSQAVMTSLSDDSTPKLSGNLNLNGHSITGLNGIGNVLARATYSTNSSTSSVASDPPTSAQGISLFSQSITTTQNNSFIEILCTGNVISTNSASTAYVAVFNGSTLLNWGTTFLNTSNGTASLPIHIPGVQLGAAGTYTINVRFGVANGSGNTVYINGNSSGSWHSGVTSTLIIKEYYT